MTGAFSVRLPREFYLRDTLSVARDLLGRDIVRMTPQGLTACRITETEAYLGKLDKACHSYKASPQGRTNVMYEDGGLAYVYLIYGMYDCFNITTCPAGQAEAVLIRSARPLEGIPLMAARRTRPGKNPPKERQLLSGPGKLCRAMDISRDLYGEPLWGDRLWLSPGEPLPDSRVGITKRINIDYAQEAADFPYRFVEKDSPWLSVRFRPEQE